MPSKELSPELHMIERLLEVVSGDPEIAKQLNQLNPKFSNELLSTANTLTALEELWLMFIKLKRDQYNIFTLSKKKLAANAPVKALIKMELVTRFGEEEGMMMTTDLGEAVSAVKVASNHYNRKHRHTEDA